MGLIFTTYFSHCLSSVFICCHCMLTYVCLYVNDDCTSCRCSLQTDLKRDWKNFCDYIKDKCSQLDMDKTKV